MTATACVFCERARKPDQHTAYGLDVVAFEPLSPVTPGHMLFLPRQHVPHAATLPWVTGKVFEAAANYGQSLGGQFNLITSCGPAATQSISHLHIHYVPRVANDGLALPWTGQEVRNAV